MQSTGAPSSVHAGHEIVDLSKIPCTGPNGDLFAVRVGAKGRGLFAVSNVSPRTLLHVAPCLQVRQDEYEQHMKHTILEHYLFNDASTGNKLLALGYGSLFNHSNRPNVDYCVCSSDLTIEYRSGHQMIPSGDELCISYGSALWFDDADGPVASTTDSSDDEDANGRVPTFLGRIQINIDDTNEK